MTIANFTKALLITFFLLCSYLLISGEFVCIIGMVYAVAGLVSMKAEPEVKIDAKFAAEWAVYRNYVGK